MGIVSLQSRHNERDSVWNHQPRDCLLNGLFRRRSTKTSKIRITGLCAGIHRGHVNSPHKGPLTRKMFLLDDVIMLWGKRFYKFHHPGPILKKNMMSSYQCKNWHCITVTNYDFHNGPHILVRKKIFIWCTWICQIKSTLLMQWMGNGISNYHVFFVFVISDIIHFHQ